MGYEFIEHTADLSIKVTAPDLHSLFREAGLALAEIMGASVADRSEQLDVSIEGIDGVDLLVRWLQELLYLIEAKDVRIGGIEIRGLSDTFLKARLQGLHEASPLEREIKAVTYHGLQIRNVQGTLEAAIIFDT